MDGKIEPIENQKAFLKWTLLSFAAIALAITIWPNEPKPTPESREEAGKWVVLQLDRDLREHPARREGALNRCVTAGTQAAGADWNYIKSCYQKLIAGRLPLN